MKELAWVNGQITSMADAKVPFMDHGYFYGFGVYEALKTYNGKAFAIQEHMDRLERSLQALHIEPDLTRDQIIAAIEDLIQQSELLSAIVYLQITRGVGPRTHSVLQNSKPTIAMFTAHLPPIPETYRENGAKAVILPDDRWAHPHIKTLNLLPNILAKQVAEKENAYEAILVRENGYISEAASSNVFAVFGDTIVTAPTDGRILNGVTRMILLGLLEQNHYHYKEDYFTEEDLRRADEIFITNTGAEVLGITELDDQKVGRGVTGRITKELYELFMQEVERRLNS